MSAPKCWTDLTEPVDGLPPAVAEALSTGRGRLAHLCPTHTLSDPESAASVLKLVGVLIDTNNRLQRHAAEVAERAHPLADNFKGLAPAVLRLINHAEFRDPEDDGDG